MPFELPVPEQTMVGGFVDRLPTVKPLGKLSVRLLIVSGVTELALVMVICRTLF